MSSRRQLRVAELVQRELAEMVIFELRDPRFSLVNITRVRVSPDLKYANVFITSLGDEKETAEAIDGLTKATGFLRMQLGQRTKLRYVPDLAFHVDEALVEGRRINELLDTLVIESDDAAPAEIGDEAAADGDE